jgi:hypothetical protein
MSLKAYDLTLEPTVDPSHSAVVGWCFGLPPGISPEEWPLDPASGYPLQHGFTLKLPSHFQVHAPGIVAISFFGAAPDHCDGGPTTTEGVAEVIENADNAPPSDPDLLALWNQAKTAHKRLHRTIDILGCHYAVIPLTADEFHGRPCPVPDTIDNQHLAQTARPQWLQMGGAAQVIAYPQSQNAVFPLEKNFLYKAIGGLPEARVDYSIPIVLRSRKADRNAGRTPEDPDYERPYGPSGTHDWAKDLGQCHLGGTMFPYQHPPQVGPCYLEFPEYFGNFNFGSGNAQLDLKTFAFYWDC